MNIWNPLVLIAGLVHLTGLFLMIRSALGAPEGFEDVSGFHLGAETTRPGARSGSRRSAAGFHSILSF